MKYYSKQQLKNIAKFLTAPFTRSGRLFLILAAMASIVMICAGCLGSPDQPATTTNQASRSTSVPQLNALTPSITPSKSSTTSSTKLPAYETFTGNGVKKTTSFTAPKSWKINWSCDLSSHNNTSYDIIIHANTINNTLLASGVETTCNKNNTHGSVTMNQAGKIYLVIISEGSWTVQVQY